MKFFEKRDLGNGMIRIDTPFGVSMFLIIGTKKAALIDTGYGVGDLKGYIRSITKLPLIVLCTHGHVDHASGTDQFERVYLNHNDWQLERKHTMVKERIEFAESLSGVCPNREDMNPQRRAAYEDVESGQIFDLGGLKIEAVACPGHTQGCMCYLVKEQRILLLGDACNSRTFLFYPETSKVEDYLDSLERLNERSDEFDRVFFFHPDNVGDKNNIEENIEVCREILAGKDDHVPLQILGCNVISAKITDNDGRRIDGKTANILYVEEKI
ncbi:MBL fold metallo-hydrolase [Blautia faecis]|uniref:MBL fold metallo-hydrolase n=1 Tax=Blautia faecis TaxID=871665 RepID=UPI00156F7B82|nr:MBL fold metallo-hydrolase [Blautia faecis]NSG90484.1 MBL fold metallo-hydrolase [Blautia faecis]